jgi:3-vinyl bacteriochlorophyllide hydratase
MFTSAVLAKVIDSIDACPWGSAAGRHVHEDVRQMRRPLYTPEERIRRDATRWTLVQGILAPIQFLVFLVSLMLVLRTLLTGEGYEAANISVVVKTFVLYTIMVTGAIWEKVVFGRYLFAPAFYWEDMFSMLVIALHTAYLATIIWSIGDAHFQMVLALAAYAAYVVNAVQFVMKLRAARLDEERKRQWQGHDHGALGYSK